MVDNYSSSQCSGSQMVCARYMFLERTVMRFSIQIPVSANILSAYILQLLSGFLFIKIHRNKRKLFSSAVKLMFGCVLFIWYINFAILLYLWYDEYIDNIYEWALVLKLHSSIYMFTRVEYKVNIAVFSVCS